jgi:hypothetical protein
VPGKPKRLDHPKSVYVIGFIFKIITIAVLIGVTYQITFSHHGPGILIPVQKKIAAQQRSAIMEEVKRQEEYEKHRHFHNVVEFPVLSESSRPICYICHSDYPHSKNKKVRALLNMHTQFFVCETCHIEESKDAEIVYKWYNPFDENPTGPFFGTSYNQETGNLAEVEDQFSKIAPYLSYGDTMQLAIKAQDAPLAKDYMKGHECKACHSKNGILNFKKLGFAINRIVDLEQLNIKGMVTKYEKFYIPKLFSD